MTTYRLTDIRQFACYGTSFKNIAQAKNYAMSLQDIGLCKTFSIGQYLDGKREYVEVYNSTAKS